MLIYTAVIATLGGYYLLIAVLLGLLVVVAILNQLYCAMGYTSFLYPIMVLVAVVSLKRVTEIITRGFLSRATAKVNGVKLERKSIFARATTTRRPRYSISPPIAVGTERFEGYLQADVYAGYDVLYASERVVEVAGWDHCRRYFEKAAKLQKKSGRAHMPLTDIRSNYVDLELKKAA